jgi:CubicO group peptidase (beta-lactamase class C family)
MRTQVVCAAPIAATLDRMTFLLERLQRECAPVPTFGAMIVRDGDVALERAADAPLCACSTIKIAVAMAVLSLVHDGAVDLDAPVLELDRDLPFADRAHAARITLRHLLSHTAGLDDTNEVEAEPRAALARLSVVAEPGRAFRYSNVAFDVAHEVAARIAGVDAFELLRARVLAPLGMRATRPDARFPRGVLVTTARDLARLATELLGGSGVVNAASRAQLAQIHADSYTAAASRYYGLGVGIERWDGLTLLQHGGGLGRHGSAFVVDPVARTAAVFLFDDPAGYGVLPHAYLDAVLGRETRAPAKRAPTVDWREYLGRYSNGARLADEAGEFVLHWNGARTPLSAFDERVFSGPGRISVGLLPGEPRMISANNFILIGARPGVCIDV